MPRISAEALMVAPLAPDKPRLTPPQGLPAAVKKAFLEVVNSVRPEHFALEDVSLVSTYAATVVEERSVSVALAKIRAAGDDDGTEEVLSRRHARAAMLMVSLARSLRLGPLSRIGGDDRRRESQALRAKPAGSVGAWREEEAVVPPDVRPWRN